MYRHWGSVQAVQSLSACTRVHFTFLLPPSSVMCLGPFSGILCTYAGVAFISLCNIFCILLWLFLSYAQNPFAHLSPKMVSPATKECVFSYRSFATTVSQRKMYDFSGETSKFLTCYNFLWVQRRHNWSPAASFAKCVMTLYLLKLHLQMFLSIPITQKCQILSCDTLVAYKQCVLFKLTLKSRTAAVAGDI